MLSYCERYADIIGNDSNKNIKIETRLVDFETKTEVQFKGIEQRFDAVEQKLDAMDQRLVRIEGWQQQR